MLNRKNNYLSSISFCSFLTLRILIISKMIKLVIRTNNIEIITSPIIIMVRLALFNKIKMIKGKANVKVIRITSNKIF